MRCTPLLPLLTLVLLAAPALRAAEDEGLTIIRVFGGGTYRGFILKEDNRTIVLRTYVGDKEILRSDVVEYRRNLTIEERAAIIRSVDPGKDLAAKLEHDKQFAVARVDTPKVEVMPERVVQHEAPVQDTAAPVHSRGIVAAQSGTWEERMEARLAKHMTVEFTDTKLSEALDVVAASTGVTIIVNPKVRQNDPPITLNVKAMDAGTLLKWLTKLTGTYYEIRNQAIYITDKLSNDHIDKDRQELGLLMAANQVDLNLLPPAGEEITDEVAGKIALAIWEKTNPKPQDYPGPDFELTSKGIQPVPALPGQ